MTSRGAAGRGRVWRSVAGVAVAASLSIGGTQVVRADEPVVDTAPPPMTAGPVAETGAPPVVESSVPAPVAIEEPVVTVGLPPVPPTTVIVAVGPQADTDADTDADTGADIEASTVVGAVAATLVAAAIEVSLSA